MDGGKPGARSTVADRAPSRGARLLRGGTGVYLFEVRELNVMFERLISRRSNVVQVSAAPDGVRAGAHNAAS